MCLPLIFVDACLVSRILIQEEVSAMGSLHHLNVAKNELRELPDGLCSISGLVYLDVQHNPLSGLPIDVGPCLGCKIQQRALER